MQSLFFSDTSRIHDDSYTARANFYYIFDFFPYWEFVLFNAHASLLLQVENPGKYMFYPKKLLSDMAELVARLAESPVFVAEVSR